MKFLIIKTSSLGDIVQSFPVVEYLKKRFPHAEIDWVVEKRFKQLVEAEPNVNEVIAINTKEWKKRLWKLSTIKEIIHFVKGLRSKKYNAVFDLQGNTKSALVTLFSVTNKRVGFGWKSAPERFNCCVTKYRSNPPKGQNIRRDYLFIVQNYFKDHSTNFSEELELRLTDEEKEAMVLWNNKISHNAWMICPGSNWPNKQLTNSQLEEFLTLVHETYSPSFIFLSGTEGERRYAEHLGHKFPQSEIADRLSPALLQHIMAKTKLVISMDSFPLHLAGTAGVPTYSFFGPSLGFKYRPLGVKSFSFQGSCPYGLRFEKRCPQLRTCKTGACLREQEMEFLFHSFDRWWEQLLRKS